MENLKIAVIAALSWVILCAVVLGALYSPLVSASPVKVYCEGAFGTITVHSGQCPFGKTFVGIKG
jgi:hypothetical protein